MNWFYVSFLLFSTIWDLVASMAAMNVTYASVDNTTSFIEISNISWYNCVVWCWSSSSCMMTLKTANGCKWCGYNDIISASLGSMEELAYKFEITGSSCPVPGTPISGIVSTRNYDVEFSDGLINFKHVPKTCPEGWQYFDRLKIEWCMKVFTQLESIDNSKAASECIANGSHLSAIESEDERLYILYSARQSSKFSLSCVVSFIWVDGYRKPNCSTSDWKTEPGCGQSFNSFYNKEDSYASLDAGYLWSDGNPDGLIGSEGMQGCIGMNVFAVADDSLPDGEVDDQLCSFTSDNSVCALGYVCGKPAT